MIPSKFDYIAANSAEEVTRLLADTPGAKVLAGGMSLLPAVKARLKVPSPLVDVGRVEGLAGVTSGWRGKVSIGAMTTHAALVNHGELESYPIFSETARVIADVQVRNRGTMGGSLAYADPAADWPAVFLALDGQVELRSQAGKRKIGGEALFVSMMTSAVDAGELLTQISFSLEHKRAGSAYVKHRQPASGLALAGAAVNLVVDRKQRIEKLAVGVTGVNAVPFLAKSLSKKLLGKMLLDAGSLRAQCGQVEEADPMEDLHGSAEYRRALLADAASRAIEKAYARACAA